MNALRLTRRRWLAALAALAMAVALAAVLPGRLLHRPAEHSAGYHLDPTELAAFEVGELGDGVRVLCYHYFRRDLDPLYFARVIGAVVLGAPTLGPQEFWTTPIGQFERHLRWFRDQRIDVLTLDDVVAFQQRGEPLPDRAVVITIDDADRSVHRLAWPLLQQYGMKAHLFVPTSRVGQRWSGLDVCTWAELAEMQASGAIVLGSHSHDLHFKVMTDRGRQPVFWNPEVIPGDQLAAARDELASLAATDVGPASAVGVDPVLTDLVLSRRLIERHGQAPCRWLAWPYGFGHGALDSLAAVAGFAGTLSLRPTTVDEVTPSWHLGRFTLTAKTTPRDIAALFEATEGR